MTTEVSARAYSIRARELGRQLRNAQARAGLDGKALAQRLGWSESRLSRVLSGRASSREVDISALLALCGITGKGRTAILRLCQSNAEPNVLRLSANEYVSAYIAHSVDASSLFEYQATMVPWVAHVPAYTRSILTTWQSSSEQVSERLRVRSLLDLRDVTLLMHEWALRNPVGPADVMSDQIHHMLRLSVRSNVSIRVIPAGSAIMSAVAGGFGILRFPDYDALIYREELSAGLFLGDADDVGRYDDLREILCASALDAIASRDFLGMLAAEFGGVADRAYDTISCR